MYIHFNSTNGGTYADIVDNAFNMYCAASDTTLTPSLAYQCRAVFVDC